MVETGLRGIDRSLTNYADEDLVAIYAALFSLRLVTMDKTWSARS